MSIPYKRKRQGKTNYKTRLQLLLAGKPRLVVRRSNMNVWCQLVEYQPDGDVVLVSAHSRELIKIGLKDSRCNVPVAYLVGFMIGKKALKKNIKEALLDIGIYSSTKGSKVYACLNGAVDAGMKIPHSKDVLPSQDRLDGKHTKKTDDYSKIKEQIK